MHLYTFIPNISNFAQSSSIIILLPILSNLPTIMHVIPFYHTHLHFTICKRARKKADQESQLPIGIFSYSSSFLHSISVPSRNTTNNVPSSKTLMWSSVFSMKSVSIFVRGSAPSVYSMNFSAR